MDGLMGYGEKPVEPPVEPMAEQPVQPVEQPVAPPVEPAKQPGQPKKVTEQDQKNHEISGRIFAAAMKIIYAKKASNQLVGILKAGADNPQEAVADASLIVIRAIQQNMKKMNPELAFALAPAIVVMIFEMAEAAGILDNEMSDSDPQKYLGETLSILAKKSKGVQ